MLIIEIDYREQKILKLINPNINIIVNDTLHGPFIRDNITFYFKISNLIIGDFIIKKNNNLDCNDPDSVRACTRHDPDSVWACPDLIYYIIERKTISDLSSSIIDGRFREQKERLSLSNSDIIYIIEGHLNKITNKGISKKILKSSIINLQIKHEFKVFKTENEIDTLEYLLLLYKKINDTGDEGDFKQIKPVTLKKKNTSCSIYINQLMMINGVSKTIAEKIAKKYTSLQQLLTAFTTVNNNQPEDLLHDLQITDKRKLGKALSKKIYTSFTTESAPSHESHTTEVTTELEVTTEENICLL
jgi:ERCC4-type nuclease